MPRNEDIDYTVSDFATIDDKSKDPDRPNESVLRNVSKYIHECIAAHNTFDVINLEHKTLDPAQQVAVHKQVIIHLRDIQEVIDSKLKELVE